LILHVHSIYAIYDKLLGQPHTLHAMKLLFLQNNCYRLVPHSPAHTFHHKSDQDISTLYRNTHAAKLPT